MISTGIKIYSASVVDVVTGTFSRVDVSSTYVGTVNASNVLSILTTLLS